MREILFRGKSTDNGEWAYGCLLVDEVTGQHFIFPSGNSCNESDKIGEEGLLQFVAFGADPGTVGQYTGLTDRNGKRIFEGDKCRVSRPCVIAYGKITFANACFWFEDYGPGGMLRLCDAKINGFEIEVIGNVHDNPELVGGYGNDR